MTGLETVLTVAFGLVPAAAVSLVGVAIIQWASMSRIRTRSRLSAEDALAAAATASERLEIARKELAAENEAELGAVSVSEMLAHIRRIELVQRLGADAQRIRDLATSPEATANDELTELVAEAGLLSTELESLPVARV